MSNNRKAQPILPQEFNIKNFSCTEFAENEFSKQQYMGFVRYKQSGSNECVFQSPWIPLDDYGLTPKEYADNENARCSMKVPLYPNAEDSATPLIELFCKIDEYVKKNIASFIPAKMKKKIKPELVTYIGLLRKPLAKIIDDDDNDDSEDNNSDKKETNNTEKPDYFRVKIDRDYESGNITTGIFVSDRDPSNPKKFLQAKKMPVKTIDDVAEYVTWKSQVRLIFKAAKFWIMKAPNTDTGKFKCGITLKVKQMEVRPSERITHEKDSFKIYAFRNNTNEDDNIENTNDENNNDVSNENDNNDTNDTNDENNNENTNNDTVDSESDDSEPPVKPDPKKKQPIRKR
jgi:hypothetical protein